MEPAVAVESGATAESNDEAGARIETVLPFAPVVWESDIAPIPASTIWVPEIPVFPAVLPPVETPAEKAAPPAPPEMVTAFPAWERVIPFPPARVIVPDEMCAIAPAVLPERVTLCRFWVWTDSVALIRNPLFVAAIEMIPSPRRESVLAS